MLMASLLKPINAGVLYGSLLSSTLFLLKPILEHTQTVNIYENDATMYRCFSQNLDD